MSEDLEPARRVTFQVTGYLKGGSPRGGWYDMRMMAGDSQNFCIPECAVDEATIADAPVEQLTQYDWETIEGTVIARLGPNGGHELVARFQRLEAAAAAEESAEAGLRARILGAVLAQRMRLGPNAIELARRGEPIRLSGGEAEELADAVLDVIAAQDGGAS